MTMSRYVTTRRVGFGHCDPAGFVFYPRFLDFVHEAEEDWLREALDWPFPRAVREMKLGLPVVKAEVDWHAPSRQGDVLEIAVSVTEVGGASMRLQFEFECCGEARASVRLVVVQMDLRTGGSVPIGDELRARLERFRAGGEPG
jgi:4-hydroxybenzoyl-CoA thioesterase